MANHSVRRRVFGRTVQLSLFSGLSGLFLILTVGLALQVFLKLDTYLDEQPESIAYSISRLEVEQLQLESAIVNLPETSAADVRRAFAALHSRIISIADSPHFNRLLGEPGSNAQASMAELERLIVQMGKIVSGPDAALVRARANLLAISRAIAPPISDLDQIGVSARAGAHSAERDSLAGQLARVTLLSLALLAALLSLLVLLWQLYRLYRKRALENRTTLKRLETILNTSQDAVLVVGPHGDILDTNRAADAMFFAECKPDGQRLHQVLYRREDDSAQRPITGAMLMKSCEAGPNLCSKVEARSATGERIPVELSADMASRSGGPVVICFIRNITRRIADHAELLAARDAALSAETAKARFLGMINHEMRTPLNGLLGTLELLEDTGLDTAQRRYAGIMQNSGQMLLTQIDDALEITQASQSGLSLTPEPFDLDDLLAGLIRAQGLAANGQGNELRYLEGSEPLGLVTGDPGRVRQVLVNLVSNAIKFTRNGEITLEAMRLEGDLVEFQINDTGIGITEEDQDRIFDDFVRLDAARPLSVEGSGLGLAIVRLLVTLMDGQITVESAPGEGSLFRVRLPLPRTSLLPAAPAGAQVEAPAPAPMDILVVEDNPTNQTVLQEMLHREGHRTWLAVDGAQGVRAAQDRRFELILMDISMPVMDGIEAAKAIRAGDGPSSTARILALSAHMTSRLDDMPAFDGVLRKPLRRATLRAALRGDAPQISRPPAQTLDPDHLTQLRATLDEARVTALLDGFLSGGDALIAGAVARASRDAMGVAKELHHFAGLAATVGATRLQAALGQAQSGLEQGDSAALRPLHAIWQQTRAACIEMRDMA